MEDIMTKEKVSNISSKKLDYINYFRGIDRIVPVGQALNIDIIWDGHDLVRELSRVVKVG